MITPTPLQDELVVDELAPRLTAFCNLLVSRLREDKVTTLELTPTFLLNSTAHQVEVPCAVNGVPLELLFTAELDAWAYDGARAAIRLRIGQQRQRVYRELSPSPTGFPMPKIIRLIMEEVRREEQRAFERYETFRKQHEAEQLLSALETELGIKRSNKEPYTLEHDNIRVKCLPETPTKVVVMAVVTQAQAKEIARTYHYKMASPTKDKPREDSGDR